MASDRSNITLVELDSFHQNYGIRTEFEIILVGEHDTTQGGKAITIFWVVST
ncbi:hypothetical protein ACLOJK_028757 [Asimina triloba]